MQNFVALGSGVSALQIREIAVLFDVNNIYIRFWVLQ